MPESAARAGLKERLKKFVSLDDKVAVLLYATGMNKIPTNLRIIHPAFSLVAQRYNRFFEELHFKIGGRFPYSEALDHVFPGLAISGLISCENPEYQFYLLPEDKRKKIEQNILPLFSPEDKILIKTIGQELRKEFQKKLPPP